MKHAAGKHLQVQLNSSWKAAAIREEHEKSQQVQMSASTTHSFTDSHPQVGFPSEAPGDYPGDGNPRHGDHLYGNSLPPLLAQSLRVFPGKKQGFQIWTSSHLSAEPNSVRNTSALFSIPLHENDAHL